MQYAKCVGLQLVSWDYPFQGSLRERIDISGLHPITVLQSITKREKQKLLDKGFVLCRMLTIENLINCGVNEKSAKKALLEAHKLIVPR
jgi:hypothetical protein|nr:hypothetical protein [Bacteroidales bacterium]